MKKLVSMLLVLVTTLSFCSGLTFAADAATVEVKLRAGTTVDVGSAEEFAAAYKEVYAADSTVNRIRLTANFTAYNVSLRQPGGNDPWMGGYEGTLCVRMPEGTCLDLNGCTLAIRANQGYDDNGTGRTSGEVSLGTVIDTFGGGRLNLYTINYGKYIGRAIELAEKYPEFVRTISISGPVEGAETYEYTIPENVCLRFSGKESALAAKSVTFKPGATSEKAVASAPGLKDAKAVIFQYVDDADAKRLGSDSATQTVKVEGTVSVPAAKTYKITVEGGDTTVSGKPAVAVKEPNVISTSSDATAEAAVITNPSSAAAAAKTTYSKAEMQKIIQETALAYYYHNPYVQYDGREVAGMGRQADNGKPEDASMDSTVYSVCSDYCWKVYHEAFNHNLFRMTYARTRTWADFPAATTPELVYQYSGPNAVNSKGETDINKALTESRKLLEPGDIIVYATPDAGHAMLFVGDCLGDGKEYILHCWGSSYDTTTGEDKREGAGSIKLQLVDEACYSDKASPNCYLGSESHNTLGFAILRPMLDPKFPAAPTAEGAARLQYPGLNITRELDRYKFTGAATGEEIPVYVTIANEGKTTLNEVPVEEHIPECTTLVEGSVTKTAKVSGSTITWAVKIPAGKSITLTYKVKVNAKLGETITFKSGRVGGIASRETSLVVGGKALTAEQCSAIYEYGKSLNGTKTQTFQDLSFFNKFYENALGVDIGLPSTTAKLLNKLTTVKGSQICRLSQVADSDKALDRMIIPLHFTGQYADNSGGNWGRVREYKKEYYEAGDIFVCLGGNSATGVNSTKDLVLMMYLGDGRVLVYTTGGVEMKTFAGSMGFALKYNVLIALRPTLAYADLNTRAPQKLAFTDVTEADWFYPYVKDLVKDGTVSGMTPTTFVPKGNLTYGQALKLIAMGLGYGEQAATADHWAGGYLALAQKEGWMTGSVDLNNNITRIAFCRIAAKAKGLTAQPANNPFKDTANTAVLALYNAGVINGMTEDTFQPNGLLTRAQISKIIYLLRDAQ